MALTLVAAPGLSTSNTYTTLADAIVVMEGVFYKDSWEAASTSNRNIALVQATRMVDEQMKWYGSKTTPLTQALEFPRDNCPIRPGEYGYQNYYDNDIIPAWLENATTIFADAILSSDRGADPETAGFKKMKLDVLELEIDKRDRISVLPEAIYDIVKFYGVKASGNVFAIRV
jgi:hypothetical protein